MKIDIDETDLEKTLKAESSHKKEKCHEDCKCESNEEIGFHKGCLNTLIGERNELIKMIQTVESIMQAHMKKLQELGVKFETQNKN